MNIELFENTVKIIRNHSMVSYEKLKYLWEYISQSKLLSSGSVIEVGSWRGGSGALIASCMNINNIEEELYLCDTFHGVVKCGDKDTVYVDGMHSDTSLDILQNLIYTEMNLKNITVLDGVFPDQTGYKVENKTFRFCHIDVDVYQSAKDAVEWLWPRMVDGGIIAFDDYGIEFCSGVTTFVGEFSKREDCICEIPQDPLVQQAIIRKKSE